MILLKFVNLLLALVIIKLDSVQSRLSRDAITSRSKRYSFHLRETRSEDGHVRSYLYNHDATSPGPRVPEPRPEHAYRGSEEYGSRVRVLPKPPIEFEPGEDNVEDIIIDQSDYSISTNTSTIGPDFGGVIANLHNEFQGNTTLNWEKAYHFCAHRNGSLACVSNDLVDRVISDAQNFVDGDGFIHVWTYNANCSSTKPLNSAVFRVDMTNKTWNYVYRPTDALPFYCLMEEAETTTYNIESTVTEITTSAVNSTETVFDTTTIVPLMCCETIEVRGLTWNSTCKNLKVVQKCTGETTGNAIWSCNTVSGNWYPKTPDLSSCVTDIVQNILNSIDTTDIPGMYNTFHKAAMYANAGGDVIAIVDVMENVTSSLVKPDGKFTDEEWLDMVENITESLADAMNSFLNSTEIWTDIPEKDRIEAAETLMETFKLIGFTLIHAMNDSAQSTRTIAKDNVFLQAIKREKGWYKDQDLSLPLLGGSINEDAILSLPFGFENDIPLQETEGNHTFVLFTTLRNMEDILIVREDDSFENRTEKTKVNSVVISINLVANETISIPLSSDVRFTVAHKNKSSDSPVCAYWNFKINNWDIDGCWIVNTNSTHTTCACNHLTNFAILMDLHGALATISESDKRALTVITYIGCVVSIITLAVCVFLTTIIRQLSCIRNTIHRNLALCLLIAEIFLLTGLERTENKTICSVVAGCLHYFFLAAFSWMLLESVYIYMLLCKVFQPRRSYVERYYLCGYGLPLLIVAISAGVNPKGYGTNTYCWLSVEKGMTWSFGAPVLIIVTINLIALIFALKTAIMISKKKSDNEEAAARKWIYGALTLVPLLGLTWGVGFLFWRDSGPVGAYIFTILNSFQGFTIFVVQVIMNKKVREIVRRKISGRFPQVAPVSCSRSGTSGNNRTTSTSEGRRSNRVNTTVQPRDRSDNALSKTGPNYCPEAPIQFINDVNGAIRSSVTRTRSYNVTSSGNSKNQRNNRTEDIVGGFDTRGNAISPTTPAILILGGQSHFTDTVI